MHPGKTPEFVKPLATDFVWNESREDNAVYLTFDDGPVPEVTPWVLELLEAYGAKATFFCVGDNVRKYPDLFAQVRSAGHAVGNHTLHHLNGWNTSNFTYFRNVLQADAYIPSRLFRPPYGKMTRSQARTLRSRYRLIMWDVLTGDFDTSFSAATCLQRVLTHTQPGSILVFHDSVKAFANLRELLPQALDHFRQQGWECLPLEESL